ncbi:release factor glutamine methyltransferase [Marinoscillum furvescens DSM 4134]|uniref:Release factor glutamine methyltransferase n=1 Tax=Marinoscillum furvescens DSM 4134 TaxID=1122208 RepID=A0A3D9L7H6_MARFU|nr:release factor glutamine methyltransferase [Marinoscillum furvescens DSM 4134]
MSAIYKESVAQLTPILGAGEAESSISILLEDAFGISRLDRLMQPNTELSAADLSRLQSAIQRLANHEPVQHIIGFCYFLGRRYKVSPDTLVPRPETEELVMHIVENYRTAHEPIKILDVGSGSGCIAISLDLLIQQAEVTGWDISPKALEIARHNALNLDSSASFELKDALKDLPFRSLDIIVSNPPYIPEKEQLEMHKNVTDFDPPLALFVPDHDPLLFYRAIGQMGRKTLVAGGKLFFEIHENFGPETRDLLASMGYQEVEIRLDLQGKDRIVAATNPPRP